MKNKTVKVKTRHLSYVYIRYKAPALESQAEAENHTEAESWIAIHRRGEGDIWQGLWEPYNISDMRNCLLS